jgi:uncharacterized protein (TIGR03086 family)
MKDPTMDALAARHQRACDGFTRVTRAVTDDQWTAPTPCPEWDARALVEHVIGFHEFLLLRPLGVRANRPREGPADRWAATSEALFTTLAANDGVLDRATALPGGGESTPRTMLAALTTDVLVHTWDLARATNVDEPLDEELCADAYEAVRATGLARDGQMIGPEVPAGDEVAPSTRLAAFYGRDPSWVRE